MKLWIGIERLFDSLIMPVNQSDTSESRKLVITAGKLQLTSHIEFIMILSPSPKKPTDQLSKKQPPYHKNQMDAIPQNQPPSPKEPINAIPKNQQVKIPQSVSELSDDLLEQ
jgi:hypothetical protein